MLQKFKYPLLFLFFFGLTTVLVQHVTTNIFAACEGLGRCFRSYEYCVPNDCDPNDDTTVCRCYTEPDNYDVGCDASCNAYACAAGGTGPADFCSITSDAPYSDAPYDAPYDYPYDAPYDYPYDAPYDYPYDAPYDYPYDAPYDYPYDSPYDYPYDAPYDGSYTIEDGTYSDAPYSDSTYSDAPYVDGSYQPVVDGPYQEPPGETQCDNTYGVCGCADNCDDGPNTDYQCCYRSCQGNACVTSFGEGQSNSCDSSSQCGGTTPDGSYVVNDGTYGCQASVGLNCSAFTAQAVDVNGVNRTIQAITKNQASTGTPLSTIRIQPNDTVTFRANVPNILPGGCQWVEHMRLDIVKTDVSPESLQLRCFEAVDNGRAYYCDNGTAKMAFGNPPNGGTFLGVQAQPPTQGITAGDGCYREGAYGSSGGSRYTCSTCGIYNSFLYCGGASDPTRHFEDEYGNPDTTNYYNYIYGNCDPNDPNTAENPQNKSNSCRVTGSLATAVNGTAQDYAQAAQDGVAKKQFYNAGRFRIEYRGQKVGSGGDQSKNNPCQLEIIVENPEPPAGTITANPTTCIIQDGQSTCSSALSWSTTHADTVSVRLQGDGAQFSPPSGNTSGNSTAPWITATPVTFELYGSSYSFPEALLSTVTVRGNPYINGDVFIDLNENGIRDTGETAYTGGGNVFINGTPTALDGTGHYARTNIIPSSYEVAFTAPAGYQLTTASPRSISLTQPTTVNFGIAPLHTVSGRIFNDRNKNRIYDTGDSLYTDNVTISGTTNGSPVEVTTNGGNYTLSDIPTGLRTISLTSPLPNGYRIIWPRGTTPPSYSVQVGPSCASGPLDTTTGASYTNQSDCDIQNLDFAISDSVPWIQMIGSDGRFDGGLNNSVANPLACNGGYTLIPGNNTAPGVLLIGPSSSSTAFGGIGAASTTNWVIGSPFPEYFTFFGGNPDAQAAGIQTSYDYLLGAAQTSNITPTNLNTLCSDLSACTLNNPPNGIYQANGDVTLTGNSTMSANRDYIFLINGNLTINGRITTPVSSTTTFSAKGDITVTQTVGVSALACPSPTTSGQIQGFFSADESIIIDAKDSTGQGANCSNGDGEDLQLNVDGALVANASLSGGSFINRRDLCAFNTTYPSLTVKERLDFVLNAPELLKTNTYIYREVAP